MPSPIPQDRRALGDVIACFHQRLGSKVDLRTEVQPGFSRDHGLGRFRQRMWCENGNRKAAVRQSENGLILLVILVVAGWSLAAPLLDN
nr:hypothetical protein [Microvirga guangxiensis]